MKLSWRAFMLGVLVGWLTSGPMYALSLLVWAIIYDQIYGP